MMRAIQRAEFAAIEAAEARERAEMRRQSRIEEGENIRETDDNNAGSSDEDEVPILAKSKYRYALGVTEPVFGGDGANDRPKRTPKPASKATSSAQLPTVTASESNDELDADKTDADDVLTPAQPQSSQRGRKQPAMEDDRKSHVVCPICNQRFSRRDHLRRHDAAAHKQDKSFGCEHCGRTFARKDNRDQHMKVHQGGSAVGLAEGLVDNEDEEEELEDAVQSEEEYSDSAETKMISRDAGMAFVREDPGSSYDKRHAARGDLSNSDSASMQESSPANSSPSKPLVNTSNLGSSGSGINIVIRRAGDATGTCMSAREDTTLASTTSRALRFPHPLTTHHEAPPWMAIQLHSIEHKRGSSKNIADAAGDGDPMDDLTIDIHSHLNTGPAKKTTGANTPTANDSANAPRRATRQSLARGEGFDAFMDRPLHPIDMVNDVKRCHSYIAVLGGTEKMMCKWVKILEEEGETLYFCDICWIRDHPEDAGDGRGRKGRKGGTNPPKDGQGIAGVRDVEESGGNNCSLCRSTDLTQWHQSLHNQSKPADGGVFYKMCWDSSYTENEKRDGVANPSALEKRLREHSQETTSSESEQPDSSSPTKSWASTEEATLREAA